MLLIRHDHVHRKRSDRANFELHVSAYHGIYVVVQRYLRRYWNTTIIPSCNGDDSASGLSVYQTKLKILPHTIALCCQTFNFCCLSSPRSFNTNKDNWCALNRAASSYPCFLTSWLLFTYWWQPKPSNAKICSGDAHKNTAKRVLFQHKGAMKNG